MGSTAGAGNLQESSAPIPFWTGKLITICAEYKFVHLFYSAFFFSSIVFAFC